MEERIKMQINLLPVEQGDCVHLRFYSEDGWHNIIVDSGPAGTAGVFRKLLEKIKKQGETIDLLCFSHIDDDHIKGAECVLGDPRYDTSIIKKIWLNLPEHIAAQKDVMGKYRPATVRCALDLWTAINTHKIPCDTCIQAGKKVQIGDRKIEVVLPYQVRQEEYWEKWEKDAKEKGIYEPKSVPKMDHREYNGVSIALLCTSETGSILLTGDAFAEDLAQVGKEHAENKLILAKLPHHGSSGNITMEMLEALKCNTFLISTRQTIHRPSPDTMRLLDEYGAKTEDVTVYGNYEWSKFEDDFEHLKIIPLKAQGEAEQIDGVEVFSEE